MPLVVLKLLAILFLACHKFVDTLGGLETGALGLGTLNVVVFPAICTGSMFFLEGSLPCPCNSSM